MEDNQFWTVWNHNGRVSMAQHDAYEIAKHDAERLAHQSPGETFFILEAVASRCFNSMQRINLRPHHQRTTMTDRELHKRMCAAINDDPLIMSLLYDLNLLP